VVVGRGKLARRALLLALLFPLAAAAVSGSSTAMASTFLGGLTNKAKYSLLAGGTAIVLAVAAIGGYAAFGGDPAADVTDLPSASPSVTAGLSPSPEASTSPSAEPSPSTSASASPSKSPSKPPSPKPPSSSPSPSIPPNTVTSMIRPAVCWGQTTKCSTYGWWANGYVYISTARPEPVTLTFSFVRLNANMMEVGATITKNVTVTVPVTASNFYVESGAVDLSGLQCGGPVRMKIKANVAGPTIPNAAYNPTLDMSCPPVIR
jgi:serine/threonine-protein kinase